MLNFVYIIELIHKMSVNNNTFSKILLKLALQKLMSYLFKGGEKQKFESYNYRQPILF